MEEHMTSLGIELSERQFGFCRRRSVDHAARLVHDKVVSARGTRWVAVTVGLAIRNAFNTIGWKVISAALERMRFPPYLRRIVGSYLSNRVLIVHDDGPGVPKTTEVTSCGTSRTTPSSGYRCPGARSLLATRTTCWSWRKENRWKGCKTGWTPLWRLSSGTSLNSGCGWPSKRHRRRPWCSAAVPGVRFREYDSTGTPSRKRRPSSTWTSRSVRGGLCLKHTSEARPPKPNGWWRHWAGLCLTSVVPRGRLLTSVVQSVLLFGAPMWTHTLRWDRPALGALAKVQRQATLRSVCAYRPVSLDAMVIVAELPPIGSLASERQVALEACYAAYEVREPG